ncbi:MULTISPECIES: hypothetical protein [Vibrio]|uniref:Uncharacterized protein n=1 Tax=Vibrio tasmaniensis TaxID=212663 RepID=A0A0H3ZW22_9VIBR|nr:MULTISPECIES: hypothetical protein [Vibrio]AKN38059.1 hypothetical protein [Vibrio tasmaniensis]OCH55042.1 hypothetical protein A6E08_20815 [Vibrio lentus]PMI60763.1 hypothetical protein BCU43_08530 [Vibrio lentus]
MSCSYVSDRFLATLKDSLLSLAYSARLDGSEDLKGFLASLDTDPHFGCSTQGATNLMRLFHVANHRAYRVRYPHESIEPFRSYKHRDCRCKPYNYEPKADLKQIAETLKAIEYLIYQCSEDGKVACDKRASWQYFKTLTRKVANMLVKNSPDYKAAQWGECEYLEWIKRY